MEWKGFVKDQLNLEAVPKAFLRIKGFDIKEDLLTSATSSFECLEVFDNISNGDILKVTDETGTEQYLGVINSVEGNIINTYQMQHIYAGNWLYDLPNILGVGDDKNWSWARFKYLIKDPNKSAVDWYEMDLPKIEDIEGLEPLETRTINDSSIGQSLNLGDVYTALATTYVFSETRKNVNITFTCDDGGLLYVNGSQVSSYLLKWTDGSQSPASVEQVTIRKGWNKIEVLYNESGSDDGWLVTIDGKHLSNYFSKLTSQYTSNVTSLEGTFAQALEAYSNGHMRDSSYVDELIKQRLSSIKVKTSSNTPGAFLTREDTYVCDMEDFIYSLYNRYQIQLNFDIPYKGPCSVSIGKCLLKDDLKVANNTNSIIDISPITEVEENNRLMIYNSDGTYRTTYITRADGSRVQEPKGTANRISVVKTSIVFSDDDDQTLQWGYLPKMYNHKLSFILRVLKPIKKKISYEVDVYKPLVTESDSIILGSSGIELLASITEHKEREVSIELYSYKDFVLGRPLQVWKDTDYFSTVLTGRELSREDDEPVDTIKFTCGTVRTKLTEKILMKYGVIK